MNDRSAALLIFKEAIPKFQSQAPTAMELGQWDRVHCLRWETTVAGGYAQLTPAAPLLPAVEELLKTEACDWPETMTAEQHGLVCRDVADEAWRQLQSAPLEIARHPVLRMKINDRVYNRMEPTARVERLLETAIVRDGLHTIVAPWVAAAYDTVERPGMMGLDAPGHRLAAMLKRLQEKYGVEIQQLWPEQTRRERHKLRVSRLAMSAVRCGVLAARAIRDAFRPFPAGRPQLRDDLPRLGVIVGGASPWYHTKPLLEACQDRFQPVIIGHDIFRNPTAYGILKNSGAPFVPIDSLLPLGRTLASLARGARRTSRLRSELNAWASKGPNQEAAAELNADLACLTELELYVDQIREAIRRYDLRAIVSANVLDSLLSAGGEACRAEGVPMACVQNTTAAYIHQPLYADCDLYFAESTSMAEFMRSTGARGEVEAVGLPIYDELIREAQQEQGGPIHAAFPELQGKKIVSLIAAPKNHDYQPLLDPLLELVLSRDDVGLVIRLHPRSPEDQYKELGDRLCKLGKGGRMHHAPLAPFLADTDYMVATVSSTTQSALVMGVRPFCWVPPEWRMYADEANQLRPEIENRWFDPKQVVAALAFALDHPEDDERWRAIWERFVKQHMTGADGQACERIVNRLAEVAA